MTNDKTIKLKLKHKPEQAPTAVLDDPHFVEPVDLKLEPFETAISTTSNDTDVSITYSDEDGRQWSGVIKSELDRMRSTGEWHKVAVANHDEPIGLHCVKGSFDICELCMKGAGGECHTPGCLFWINRAPDLPLRSHILIQGGSIDGHSRCGSCHDVDPKLCEVCRGTGTQPVDEADRLTLYPPPSINDRLRRLFADIEKDITDQSADDMIPTLSGAYFSAIQRIVVDAMLSDEAQVRSPAKKG